MCSKMCPPFLVAIVFAPVQIGIVTSADIPLVRASFIGAECSILNILTIAAAASTEARSLYSPDVVYRALHSPSMCRLINHWAITEQF